MWSDGNGAVVCSEGVAFSEIPVAEGARGTERMVVSVKFLNWGFSKQPRGLHYFDVFVGLLQFLLTVLQYASRQTDLRQNYEKQRQKSATDRLSQLKYEYEHIICN